MYKSNPVYTQQLNVRDYERDICGGIPPWTLCNYLQMAAAQHAFELGWAFDQLAPRGLTWVLSRLWFSVESLPLKRRVLTVETWPCGTTPLTARRDFALKDSENGATLVKATSTWVMFNLKRRRPARIPKDIACTIPSTPPLVLPACQKISTSLNDMTKGEPFRVRLSDIDINGHVNNARHVEWAADALHQYRPDAKIARASLEFHGEANLNQRLQVCSLNHDAYASTHALKAVSGETPLALVHFTLSQENPKT